MTEHYFNALEYAHQLEKAGVPTAQAEVHANALAMVLKNCFSSATEVEGAKSEVLYKISELEVKLRTEISTVEATLRAEIREAVASVRTDLTERIDRLEARMEERFRWQWWANGVMVAMLIGLYFR
jgi:hypothetical protein